MMKVFGNMVSFATWKKFILASAGSAEMKRRVIECIGRHVIKGDDLIDCFVLGWMLGQFSNGLSVGDELQDFERTIVLTRDLNNVPIVERDGEPVS